MTANFQFDDTADRATAQRMLCGSGVDAATRAAGEALELTARLYTTRGESASLHNALRACAEWVGCSDVLTLCGGEPPLDPDALAALAGRVTHCAVYGVCACSGRPDDAIRRARCAALAPHLHAAAQSLRNALRAQLFDQLPPTWLVNRAGRVQDSNASAKVVLSENAPLALHEGQLAPSVPGGGARLRAKLADLAQETRFSWPLPHGGEATLLLRPSEVGEQVVATLLPEPPTKQQLVDRMATYFKLTRRQSELAVKLFSGCTVTEAAREMGITRNTANEHLVGLMQRIGVSNRKALVEALWRVCR